MVMGKTGEELAEVIKAAIRDLEITHSEYDRIMMQASKDGVIDDQERGLLRQLHELIANGTVRRVAD
jgi:hypothetical protein